MIKVCIRTPPYLDEERTKHITHLPGVPRVGDFIERSENWKRCKVVNVVWVPETLRTAYPPEIFVEEVSDAQFPAPKIASPKK